MQTDTRKTYLLCLDPGKASGCAILDTTTLQTDRTGDVEIVETVELQPSELNVWLLAWFNRALVEKAGLEAVCENFLITPQTGKNSTADWSLKKIGVLEFLGEMFSISVTLQTPAAAKSFVDNKRLRALGLWHKGGAGHANDALRHGVLYLVNKRGWNPEDLLSG